VSGPADSVASFISELQNEGVFVKTVNSGGLAFHSYYMSPVATALRQRLDQVFYAYADVFYISQLVSLLARISPSRKTEIDLENDEEEGRKYILKKDISDCGNLKVGEGNTKARA